VDRRGPCSGIVVVGSKSERGLVRQTGRNLSGIYWEGMGGAKTGDLRLRYGSDRGGSWGGEIMGEEVRKVKQIILPNKNDSFRMGGVVGEGIQKGRFVINLGKVDARRAPTVREGAGREKSTLKTKR